MIWLVLALASALFSAFQIVITKKNLKKEHALEFNAVRGVFTIIIISIFLLPFINFQTHPKVIALVYIISVIASIGIYYTSRAIRHLDVSTIAPMQNIQPIFIVILAFIFLGERITQNQFIGIILLLFGTYVLQIDHHNNLFHPIKRVWRSKFIHFALFALIIFSITSIFEKFAVDYYIDPVTFMFLMWLFISLHLILMESYMYGFAEIVADIKKQGKLIFLVSLFGVFANLSYFLAINLQDVSIIVPLRKLSTLFATVFGGTLFHEKNLRIKLLACIILIVGVYLIII